MSRTGPWSSNCWPIDVYKRQALLNSLSSSSSNRKEVEVTITEGMTVQQIFQLLEEEGVSTVDKLNDCLLYTSRCV